MAMDISSSLSHDSSKSVTSASSVPPRRRGGGRSGRGFLVSLSFAVLLVTILQYTFSLTFSYDFFTATQGSNTLMLHSFMMEREVPLVEKADRDPPDYHMIFSSSCVPLQHWQSYLFFYSALKVGQRGNVTRIVSGCNEKETQEQMEFYKLHIRPMSDRFHVHFTPDFSRVTLDEFKEPYKYMNKPYGVRHWMEHVLGLGKEDNQETASSRLLDGIVMLLDPDIVLLRPLRHDFTNEELMWAGKQNKTRLTRVVRHGFPIAQQDAYLGNDWMNMNWSHITGLPAGQYLEPPSESRGDGEIYWNSGPPYLATVKDMYAIAVRWTEYSSRILELKDRRTGIFGEMFGYIIASYQLKLPHTLIPSIVVSLTESENREGWPYIDRLAEDQVCRPNDDLPMSPSSPMPVGLHYCQRYMLGEYFFVKYRVKKKIIDCDKPLYVMPPKDLLQRYNYMVIPMRADLQDKDTWKEVREVASPTRAKREAFMLCRMTAYLNDALRYYKERACDGKGNMNETLSVYIDPTDLR